MRKFTLYMTTMVCMSIAYSQSETRISSIDFVEVLNGNHEEALYYYQNNWRWLRELAVEKGYIADYEFFQVERTPETPYDLILMTIYGDLEQSEKREDHFAELIAIKGPLRLLNDKQPGEFRKLLEGVDVARHLAK